MEQEVPDHLKNETIDMSSFSSDDNLKKGRKLAFEYAALEASIKNAEADIEKWKVRRLELQRKELPEFFDNVLHVDNMGLPEAGVDVKIVPFFHANIKSEWDEVRREAGFDYLEKEDYGEIIAVVLSVKFPRGDFDQAKELAELIRQSRFGNMYDVKLEKSVPWNTLTSVVKEMVENGEKVNLEVLGATVGRTAKIVKRKAK